MTFIASVIARGGIAVVADSFVTSTQRIITERDFFDLLKSKSSNSQNKITLIPEEITKLFKIKPSHTRDYENKLFMYDKYTAITTSGMAAINNRRIEEIICDKIDNNNKKKATYRNKSIKQKVNDLCDFLTEEVKKHINKYSYINSIRFIISHFDKKNNKAMIFRANIIPSSKEDLTKADYKFIESKEAASYEKVVCDGQNRISEGVLYGNVFILFDLIPKLVDRITKDFNINSNKIPKNYIGNLLKDKNIITKSYWDDIKLFKLKDLSLQQAVDLACLLMNIEIDFQKYTETIPTVGGVIRLAVINDKGFKYISGDDIVEPPTI